MGERPRPLPRRRRPGPPELAPAWQQLETERPPTGSLPLAPVLPRPSYGGLSESEFRNEAYRGTARELMANEFNRPPEMYRGERVLGPFLEMTGAPSLVRSYARARDGDPWGSAGEAAMGALAIGGVRATMREPIPRPAPAPIPPTRVYRGLNEPYDVDRAERLGDRWWHTNPEVASTYAPGSTGAHVIPGVIDENALNLARVETPPGTMWRAIPVRALPRDVRAGFPRGTEYVTSHEAAAAAESAGYDGITFQGMRDSGFAAAMDVYPGLGTGDDGRVVAVFNNNIVRSPFGALPREPMPRPPSPEPRLPGRASDGSVLPVAPSRPFTNSLRGGSDDLSEAAVMGRSTLSAGIDPTRRPAYTGRFSEHSSEKRALIEQMIRDGETNRLTIQRAVENRFGGNRLNVRDSVNRVARGMGVDLDVPSTGRRRVYDQDAVLAAGREPGATYTSVAEATGVPVNRVRSMLSGANIYLGRAPLSTSARNEWILAQGNAAPDVVVSRAAKDGVEGVNESIVRSVRFRERKRLGGSDAPPVRAPVTDEAAAARLGIPVERYRAMAARRRASAGINGDDALGLMATAGYWTGLSTVAGIGASQSSSLNLKGNR